MCMIDFGCYTNHSIGESTVAEYNEANDQLCHFRTFICDRYSVDAFSEIEAITKAVNMGIHCGLEIDISVRSALYPVKCVAVSGKGIENLCRIAKRAKGTPLCMEDVDDIRDGVLIGFCDGYWLREVQQFADYLYLTPSFSESECKAIYEAGKRIGKPLCAATNAEYIPGRDEGVSDRMPMLSEHEMFERLECLGHDAAWEILIDNPFKLLEPYDFLCHDQFPGRWYRKLFRKQYRAYKKRLLKKGG